MRFIYELIYWPQIWAPYVINEENIRKKIIVDGGGLSSCCLQDENKGEGAAANAGWETRRTFLSLYNRMEADDPDIKKFRFSVRLEDISGFAADYDCVMYGFNHTLTLIQNLNNKDALFGEDNAA